MSRRLIIRFLMSLLLLFFYAFNYKVLLQVQEEKNITSNSIKGIWDLPPVVLLAMAGEFKGLVADYLTLEAGAQIGTHLIRNQEGKFQVVAQQHDWSRIRKIFKASQLLDPSFAQTYIVMQGTFPWQPVNMVAETQEFLKTTIENRPWDWQPTHIMGFNLYYFLNKPGDAGKYFLEASKVPGAPSYLAILGARLAQEGGITETAVVLMKSMLASKNPEEPGYVDVVDRLNALEGVLVIEQAVKEYEMSKGYKPASLMELVDSEVLKDLPVNPYNLSYCMDSAGKVYFDNPDCKKEN